MAKSTKTRRRPAAPTAGLNGRDLWLAGLGAVSLGRKQGLKLYTTLRDEGRALQQRAGNVADNLGEQVRQGIGDVRARLQAAARPLRGRAESIIAVLTRQAQARLQPVLGRFGVSRPKARRAAAKRAPARKPVGKQSARKATGRRRAA